MLSFKPETKRDARKKDEKKSETASIFPSDTRKETLSATNSRGVKKDLILFWQGAGDAEQDRRDFPGQWTDAGSTPATFTEGDDARSVPEEEGIKLMVCFKYLV